MLTYYLLDKWFVCRGTVCIYKLLYAEGHRGKWKWRGSGIWILTPQMGMGNPGTSHPHRPPPPLAHVSSVCFVCSARPKNFKALTRTEWYDCSKWRDKSFYQLSTSQSLICPTVEEHKVLEEPYSASDSVLCTNGKFMMFFFLILKRKS